MAAAVASARAIYKQQKAKNLNASDGLGKWVSEFQNASQSLGFAGGDDDDDAGAGAKKRGEARRASVAQRFEARETDCYVRLAHWVHARVVETRWFDNFVTACILLVAVGTGIEVSYLHDEDGAPPAAELFMTLVAQFTLGVFTLECGLKIVAHAREPLGYFTDPEDGGYNKFDFTIVFVSIVGELVPGFNAGAIAVLRLLRLVRVMQMFSQLRVILKGLLVGLRSVSSIMMLLMLIIYMFAVLGVTMFSENDPAHFGTVGVAMLTLFRIATLASWKLVYDINYYGCDRYNAGLYAFNNGSADDVTVFGGGDRAVECTGRRREDVQACVAPPANGAEFPLWYCARPAPYPVAATVFLFTYSILTAYVIISLFIGVITLGMLEAMEEEKTETKEREYAEKLEKNSELNPQEEKALRLKLDFAYGRKNTGNAAKTSLCAFPEWYLRLAQRAAHLAKSDPFQGFIVVTIIIVAVAVGWQTDYGDSALLTIAEDVIQNIFAFECAVKLVAEGEHPSAFFYDPWNSFDFFIVLAGYLGSYLPVDLAFLRLVRLLRVFKLARSFPSLRIIVEALLASMSGVSYIMIMILVMNFIFAAMGIIFFGRNDPQHFGDLSRAMMTVWICETLDGWEDVLYINVYGCDLYGYTDLWSNPTMALGCDYPEAHGWMAALYFIALVVFGAFVMPTVLIGVISISFEESTQQVKEDLEIDGMVTKVIQRCENEGWYPGVDLRRRAGVLREVFAVLDCDGEGSLDVNELRPFMTFFLEQYLGLKLAYEHIESMFYALDVDNSADINFAEFLWFMFSCKQYIPSDIAAGGGEKKEAGEPSDTPVTPFTASDGDEANASSAKLLALDKEIAEQEAALEEKKRERGQLVGVMTQAAMHMQLGGGTRSLPEAKDEHGDPEAPGARLPPPSATKVSQVVPVSSTSIEDYDV